MNKATGYCCSRVITTILTMTFLAVMYVNQQALVYQMGLKVKQNNDVYSKLVDHNKILVYNVLNLRSPVTLEKKLLAKEVELSMPSKWQVVKVDHSPEKLVLYGKKITRKGLIANLFESGR